MFDPEAAKAHRGQGDSEEGEAAQKSEATKAGEAPARSTKGKKKKPEEA
jgi:hypothetical protein